ncbi:hypothetical protein GLAREA_10986 [Glarea lozoyensis ATCC 20868]|uniref:Uncharacterized protein n=1 Tax=Glarea lozoyensis (strain ATCC 20868 / MF5171) TaxID=1116229 RepID=S3DA31_GLAL2|nr:uncharacterized protein GLAREA_10986 [Glarea lozoyensis ATCC 20868]EPE35287.1 hypothetical protein GLAREA_10986 [Glarea lozoyensis ATCC 20868]
MKIFSLLTIFALNQVTLSVYHSNNIDYHYSNDNIDCSGSLFNNLCCVNGTFSGEVISSLIANFHTIDAQNIRASVGLRQSAIREDIDRKVSAWKDWRRDVVTSGLTCDGDAVVTMTMDGASDVIASLTNVASATDTVVTSGSVIRASSESGMLGVKETAGSNSITAASRTATATSRFTGTSAKSTESKSTATSTGGVGMITQPPKVFVGGVIMAVAYGIM